MKGRTSQRPDHEQAFIAVQILELPKRSQFSQNLFLHNPI